MIVVAAAIFLGFLVIGFLSRFAVNVPRVDSRSENEKPDGRPPIPAQEFEQTIRRLLGALRVDVLSVSTEENDVLAMTCRDPRPVIGGRLLVRAKRLTSGGQVDAAEVLAFADNVRGDTGALKGIDIAAAGFTDQAYTASGATPAVIELIDAARLVDSVREYVPERADLLERYRPFSSGAHRHERAIGPTEAIRPSVTGSAPDLLPN